MTMPPFETSRFPSLTPLWAILAHSLLFALALVFTAAPLYAENSDSKTSIRKSVLALDSARQTALQELKSPSMSTSEVSDYRDFIVFLNTRIVTYCRELAEQEGMAALEGLPCPAGPMMSGTGGTPLPTEEEIFYTIGPGAAETRTQAEKTAEIDESFLAALGNFDEMLLKEEEKVASRVPSQRESGSSGQAGEPGSGGASGAGESGSGKDGDAGGQGERSEGEAGAEGRAEGQAGQAGTASGAQRSAGAGDANVDHSAYGAPGGKLPPPEDDDIVARQLREAAEKEPDPELKKKLWEEYWKYKGVSKRGE
jgi:hypothetical protein